MRGTVDGRGLVLLRPGRKQALADVVLDGRGRRVRGRRELAELHRAALSIGDGRIGQWRYLADGRTPWNLSYS
ncbi:hypothetical protein NU639_10290 [Corynebacterium amycolatum]|nr:MULTISPECIES: hypothetical protein [Corynebacterium]MDK8850507.1 hypothetical protein [Corynebacterium sp. MSK019]UVE00486.1 hypothetical protein NU639_10290 [Corynebacterium amycolatum]